MREWLSSWVWAFRVYRLLALSCRLGFHFTPAQLANAGLIVGGEDDPWEGQCAHRVRQRKRENRRVDFQTITPDWDRP